MPEFSECRRDGRGHGDVSRSAAELRESAAKTRFYFSGDGRGGERKQPIDTHATTYTRSLVWELEMNVHSSCSWLAQLSLLGVFMPQ